MSDSTSVGANSQESEPYGTDLGPFDPPHDFDHGDEFEAPVPRPVPSHYQRGSYASRTRGAIFTLLWLGVIFIIAQPLPYVQGLAHYILPLAWLHWIGMGLIAIAGWMIIARMLQTGRYKYIRTGTPFVGRILQLDTVAGGNEQVPQFKIAALVEYVHPETGELTTAHVQAEEFWNVTKFHEYRCTLHPGDYVTLVGIPGKIDPTVKIFGFLGLDPQREFLLRHDRPIQGMTPTTATLIALSICSATLMLMLTFDVLMFSFPVDGDWKLAAIVTALGMLGGGAAGYFVRHATGVVQRGASRRTKVIVFGCIGAIAALLSLFVLNSRLDDLPPQLAPVEILQYWQTTHNLVVRDYDVEYRPIAGGEATKRHIRFSQMVRLGDAKFGALEIGPGRFGYAWVRGVDPIVWVPAETVQGVDGDVYTVTMHDNGRPGKLVIDAKPVIELNDDTFAPAPNVLVERAVEQLRREVEKVERKR